MTKPIKRLQPMDVDDAMDGLNNPAKGDIRIIRIVNLTVPMDTIDTALVGAAFDLMSQNPPGPDYKPDPISPGSYDLVIAIHIRKADNHTLH